ncbi:mitochondrial amidoxime-reducing component 1-like isoform X1 [Babylonia areolata]|uniref:mitochondrial amidoxime-reducing component 1-like isoform X1 n=1 Tax=Babylonia areolata TaxID=304850 RepID=UPI003FD32155
MFSSFPLDFLLSKEGAVFTALVATSALKYVSLQRVRAARDQEFTLVGHVSELTVYPIKACGGVDLQSAQATDVGLCADGYYDRRWMIQSKDTGSYVNMRMHPRLTLVTTTVDSDWFVVSAPDMTPLHLPRYPNPAEFEHVNVNIYGQTLRALDVGSEASDWFTRFLRQPVRLLHAGPGVGTRDAYYMPLSWETEARKGDKTVFGYLTAYLMCTTASLAELNSRMDNPVIIRNFRPNIVVDSSIPFDEDSWEEIRIGSAAKFHYVQPCRRCVITTVDPNTAEVNAKSQPLATLRKYRERSQYGHAPLFGAYISLDCQGPIKVGDPVYVIRRQSPAF